MKEGPLNKLMWSAKSQQTCRPKGRPFEDAPDRGDTTIIRSSLSQLGLPFNDILYRS